jgi:integrase
MPESVARKAAAKLQAEVRLGGDPAAKKAQARETAATTMAGVLQIYLPIKRAKLRPRSYTETERHLLVGFKRLHPRPVRQITTAMVSAAYEAMVVERGATAATNAWRSLHAFFDWALRQWLIDRNPAIGVERRNPRVRSRVLTADDIKAVWDATANGVDHDKIVRLLLLSGARASEIGHLRWSEVLPDRIALAPERTKNDRGRSIPLTPTIRTVPESHPRQPGRDYVFGRSAKRPFSGWSAGKAVLNERLGGEVSCLGRARFAAHGRDPSRRARHFAAHHFWCAGSCRWQWGPCPESARRQSRHCEALQLGEARRADPQCAPGVGCVRDGHRQRTRSG